MDVLTVDVPGIFTEHGKGSVPVGFKELAMPKATDATFVNKACEFWWVWINDAGCTGKSDAYKLNKSPASQHVPTPISSPNR